MTAAAAPRPALGPALGPVARLLLRLEEAPALWVTAPELARCSGLFGAALQDQLEQLLAGRMVRVLRDGDTGAIVAAGAQP